MSIWATLGMRVQEGMFEQLSEFLQQNLPNVRGFDGALQVVLFYNPETRDFLIHEEWISQAKHQAYIEFITANGVMQSLLSFMEGAPTVTYYDRLTM